jgi:cobalt-zinc-cadmium efflux system membrane fusion protein
MDRRAKNWIRLGILGVLVVALVILGVAAGPRVIDWLQKSAVASEPPEPSPGSHRLFKDPQGRPGLELPPEVVDALHIRTVRVKEVSKEKALPLLLGTLNYDPDFLYPARSIGNGKVTRIASLLGTERVASPSSLPRDPRDRPVRFGDYVKKGQLLAVVRSPDLADKKGNYVDALLDLHVDEEKLAGLEGPYRRGAIAPASYRDAVAKVEKDLTAVNRARRTLELAELKPDEIERLDREAETIKKRLKELLKKNRKEKKRLYDREQVDQWARVEIRAPHAGVIVEKNTNVGDIVDPGKDPPPFRIADLNTVGVWIHPPAEYLPVLQKLLKRHKGKKLRMELRLQSNPTASPLQGELIGFAPSLDPNLRLPLLLGRIKNPRGNLLIGELLTAKVFVPQETDLVQIPPRALNEVGGQSLVFVKVPGGKDGRVRFALRRVAVVNRFADAIQVRSVLHLTREEQEQLKKDLARGLRPIEPLRPGERVAVGGVVEMTDALEDLKNQKK